MAINRVSDGRYVELSTADPNALGYSREELIGRSALDVGIWVDAADRDRFRAKLRAERVVSGYETRLRTKSGEIIDCMIWGALMEFDGEPCLLSSTVNVSAQKRHEAVIRNTNEALERRVAERTVQLQAANRELEAFSYSVSHDLRAPLRAIDGFVRILAGQQGEVDDTLRVKAQERVLSATRRMNELIEDLIALARVSRQDVHLERVDLSALAREVGERFAESQREREPGRVVDLRVADGFEARCDRALMRIVLENLLGNAWKFTGKVAQPAITFASENLPDGSTAFVVRDNGAGFDPQYAGRLFAPFQRLHTEAEFEGTGILYVRRGPGPGAETEQECTGTRTEMTA